jgi:hypothetical protein
MEYKPNTLGQVLRCPYRSVQNVQNLISQYFKCYNYQISLFHRAFWSIKFYSHQLMHFLKQICISLLSYIKIT